MPRFVLIARLAKVETLNGSQVNSSYSTDSFLQAFEVAQVFHAFFFFQVSPRERKDSEIRYVLSF